MLRVLFPYCHWTPYGVVAHDVARLLSLPDACPTASQTCNSVLLVRVHLIKPASNTGVGFQLCQSQNEIHFLPHGKINSTEAKRDDTQLFVNGTEFTYVTLRACA